MGGWDLRPFSATFPRLDVELTLVRGLSGIRRVRPIGRRYTLDPLLVVVVRVREDWRNLGHLRPRRRIRKAAATIVARGRFGGFSIGLKGERSAGVRLICAVADPSSLSDCRMNADLSPLKRSGGGAAGLGLSSRAGGPQTWHVLRAATATIIRIENDQLNDLPQPCVAPGERDALTFFSFCLSACADQLAGCSGVVNSFRVCDRTCANALAMMRSLRSAGEAVGRGASRARIIAEAA